MIKTFIKSLKRDWWKYALSIIIVIVYLLPIYVVGVSSLKSRGDVSSRLSLPDVWYIENYIKVIQKSGILTAYKNTIIIAVGAVFLVVILGCMAAYPMTRCKNTMSKIIKTFVLGVMMVPGICMVVGVYSTLVSIEATSTYWGMILVLVAFNLPLSIFMYSNFVNTIPITLDEAAAIDGAGSLRTFFEIIIPQLKPVTVSIVLMQGIAIWNEYQYALYILQKPAMYNVTLIVKQYFGTNISDLNGAAACAMVAILPVLVVYVFMQRFFIEGAMSSAVKG